MAEKIDFFIKGKYILPMNEAGDVLENAGVAVLGTKIIDIGVCSVIEKKYEPEQIIDIGRGIIMPGLINTHTHAAKTLFRGIADDLPLDVWLKDHIWPAESRYLDRHFARVGSDLACLEMIKSGITCFNDMYMFEDATAEAAIAAGLRATIGELIINFSTNSAKTPQDAFELLNKQLIKYAASDLINVAVAPHSIYTCDEKILIRAGRLAEDNQIKIHMHLSETKFEYDSCLKEKNKTPVEYLESIGFLSENVIAVHAVCLSEKDLEILKKYNVAVSHNPVSNMKLASGISPLVKMLQSGINVSLGTDGCASNNTLDIFSDIRVCALLHKVSNFDASLVTAKQLVFMATTSAAKTLGREKELGSLEVGKKADIISIDLHKPHLTPVYDPYSHLAYCVSGADVRDVVVNGKVLMKNRVVLTMDEEKIINQAEICAAQIK